MTAPYKKRAKAGWSSDKDESNKAERAYEPDDIADQVSEKSLVSAVVTKKKPSKREKEIKKHINDLKWALKWARGKGLESLKEYKDGDAYFGSHKLELYRDAKKALPILREEVNKLDLPSKIKKHIRELLDQVGDEE